HLWMLRKYVRQFVVTTHIGLAGSRQIVPQLSDIHNRFGGVWQLHSEAITSAASLACHEFLGSAPKSICVKSLLLVLSFLVGPQRRCVSCGNSQPPIFDRRLTVSIPRNSLTPNPLRIRL